jgi:tetratricopeptide (TPR) repeat protein
MDDPHTLVVHARNLCRQYRHSEAEDMLQRALEACGDDPESRSLVAQTYRLIQRPLIAIQLLESLRADHGLSPPLLGELAILYEQTNQTAAALTTIRECVDRAPGQLEPQLVLARILRETGDLQSARELLEAMLARSDAAPLLSIRARTELGQLYDAQGNYAAAVAVVEPAKQMLRATNSAQRLADRATAINRTLRQLYAELDDATVETWRDETPVADPRYAGIGHLIGFPRTGTTLLEQILAAHPDLVVSAETSVFSHEIFPQMLRTDDRAKLSLAPLKNLSVGRLSELRTRYLDCLQAVRGEAFDGRWHLDKNPNHTSLSVGLFRLFPEAKFVFAVRDPRDVMVSAYLHFFPLTEFSAMLLSWQGCCEQYCADMDLWLAMRDRLAGQAIQVRYEDVVDRPLEEGRRVLEFLGLGWHDAVANYRQKLEGKFVFSPSYVAVRRPIHRRAMGRWRNYARYLEPLQAQLEPYCKEFGYE